MNKISKLEIMQLLDPDELGVFLVNNIENDLRRIGLSDSRMIKNINYRKIEKNQEWLVQVILPKYSIYVDGGRRAGSKPPPVGAIIDWIRRKRILPKNGTIGQLAFAIAKSIAKNGIKARPFLKNIPEYTNEWIEFHLKEVVNIIGQDVANQMKQLSKNNIYFTVSK